MIHKFQPLHAQKVSLHRQLMEVKRVSNDIFRNGLILSDYIDPSQSYLQVKSSQVRIATSAAR